MQSVSEVTKTTKDMDFFFEQQKKVMQQQWNSIYQCLMLNLCSAIFLIKSSSESKSLFKTDPKYPMPVYSRSDRMGW